MPLEIRNHTLCGNRVIQSVEQNEITEEPKVIKFDMIIDGKKKTYYFAVSRRKPLISGTEQFGCMVSSVRESEADALKSHKRAEVQYPGKKVMTDLSHRFTASWTNRI